MQVQKRHIREAHVAAMTQRNAARNAHGHRVAEAQRLVKLIAREREVACPEKKLEHKMMINNDSKHDATNKSMKKKKEEKQDIKKSWPRRNGLSNLSPANARSSSKKLEKKLFKKRGKKPPTRN